jgi:enamine deaminase RidA (YjgF/YER057c/UK114 family)
MTTHRILLPDGWPRPKGYANGIAAKGTTVFLGGQIGWNEKGVFASGFVGQVRQALENIARLLAEAGASPETLVRLNWFVTDLAAYTGNLKEIGKTYRDVLGTNYPAMTLVHVVGLVEPEALVEIEATAVIPD